MVARKKAVAEEEVVVVEQPVLTIETLPKPQFLIAAKSSIAFDGSVGSGGFSGVGNGNNYLGDSIESLLEWTGNSPEKLIVPKNYHRVLNMCYDFYQRGGVVSTVINRLTELTITEIRNGQRKTSNEANDYYDAVLHRNPSRMMRFLRTMGLEYFLSGMVLPKVDWVEVLGSDLSPKLKATRKYMVPTFDMYPPKLVRVVWSGWGQKDYYLKVPQEDISLIKSGGSKIKEQQLRYDSWVQYYPTFVELIRGGQDTILIQQVDPIIRKETSFTAYPTPFLNAALESLMYKEKIRQMDFAVASRVISAILLVQEGDKDFPLTEDNRQNLDALQNQLYARTGNPRLLERLFMLFSNHTTKLTWISPDVEALLDQDKYRETNAELSQALGFAEILITGESRNAQAAELSTWAIMPQMLELQGMLLEWMRPIYEQAALLNSFRNVPEPAFKPIQLQDFVKTAAVFAQAFKEGNISRTTRDEQIGLNFETEQELMIDEKALIDELNKEGKFKDMPYNVQVVPGMNALGNGLGRPPGALNTGGRPQGSQNVPVNNRNRGVKPSGQQPASRIKTAAEKIELLPDEEVIELMNMVAEQRGIYVTAEDIKEENE